MAVAEFTGSGTLTATGESIVEDPFFSGSGTLSAVAVAITVSGTAGFTAAGTMDGDGGSPVSLSMTLGILDPSLIIAPTTVTVVVTGANPNSSVAFDIDGVANLTATADSGGNLGPLSLPVSEAVGTAGSHIVTATQGSLTSSATFTLQRAPALAPIVRGVDADPVEVPGAIVGTGRRWVLQDLMPGGLGSYIMPWNPTKMTTPPHFERPLNAVHTTAESGQYHVYEGGPAPVEWKFSGYCNQALHDKLVAFHALNRRFYVIDHRSRAWKVTFVDVDLVARRRQIGVDGLPTDWGHDYTVTALVYDQDWVLPV